MSKEHPISKWMKANNVATQTEAARLLGISQQGISDYVNWNHVPRPRKLRALAAKLGCSVGSLIPPDSVEQGAA